LMVQVVQPPILAFDTIQVSIAGRSQA